jgi:L-rhamnose mutarotase
MVEEYERRHEEVWPDLLGDLWAAGWRNYSLFRRGLEVYGYAECHPDVATALAAMGSSEANARWAEWFTEVIEVLTDESGALRRAPQVWRMDEAIAQTNASDRGIA